MASSYERNVKKGEKKSEKHAIGHVRSSFLDRKISTKFLFSFIFHPFSLRVSRFDETFPSLVVLVRCFTVLAISVSFFFFSFLFQFHEESRTSNFALKGSVRSVGNISGANYRESLENFESLVRWYSFLFFLALVFFFSFPSFFFSFNSSWQIFALVCNANRWRLWRMCGPSS